MYGGLPLGLIPIHLVKDDQPFIEKPMLENKSLGLIMSHISLHLFEKKNLLSYQWLLQ